MKNSGLLKYSSGIDRHVWITSLGWFFVRCFLSLSLLTLPVAVKAQFTYTTNNNQISITKYTGSASELVIPVAVNGQPVTSIGDSAFRNCTTLTSIAIPNSVTIIRSFAFSGCKGLTSIAIPNSVTSIGDSAFSGCTGLTSIAIPDSVTRIGYGAFSGCKGLTSIAIPNSVTSIGDGAFSGCTGLTSIAIPDSVTSIRSFAFSGCIGLTSLTIPNSVTSIEDRAFSGCTGLTSIAIPNSVTSIRDFAFYGCTGLTSLTIPNSVTSIRSFAFSGCTGLTSIAIPISVTSIGYGAFSGCTGLKSIDVDAANLSYISVDGVLFNKSRSILGIYPSGKIGFYTIPYSVTSIGNGAFSGCKGLTSIAIPNSVTSIGFGAFSGCKGLTSIAIPNSVTSIGDSAFSGCTGLTSIAIPNSVTRIGRGPFSDCTGLKSIDVDAANLSYISVDGVLFNKSRSILGTYPSGKIGFYTIPYSVTSIGDSAFSGCTGLTSITIPNSVTSIGSFAFSGCTGLTSLTIPNSVTSIGYGAFDSLSRTAFAHFQGNAPIEIDGPIFNNKNLIIYFDPGTTGWANIISDIQLKPWNPLVQYSFTAIGAASDNFQFNVVGTANLSFVIEAATNLVQPVWKPLGTNTEVNGTIYFTDPQWQDFPTRFYRLRMQ